MAEYRALVLNSTSEPVSLEKRPVPTAGPGSVIVKVLGLAIGSTIPGVLDGSLGYAISTPMVPGSNCIARIHSIGPDSTSLTPGQLVYCDITVRPRDNPNSLLLMGMHGGNAMKLMEGEWRDGSYAEYAKFPLENVFPLDEEVLLRKLGYGVEDLSGIPTFLVPFGGLSEINVRPGDTVIVAPATGKFGGGAVTTALALGASVVACGRNADTLKTMSNFFSSTGRLHTVILTSDISNDTKALISASGNGGIGADAFIDLSPASAAKTTHIQAALGALRPGGKAAFMGGIWGAVEIDYSTVMLKNLRIQGRFMYDRDMVLQMIKMIEKGNLKLGENGAGIKTVGSYGLEDFGEALEAIKKETGWGKQIVLLP